MDDDDGLGCRYEYGCMREAVQKCGAGTEGKKKNKKIFVVIKWNTDIGVYVLLSLEPLGTE